MLAFPPGYKKGKCPIVSHLPYADSTVERVVYDTYSGPFYVDNEDRIDRDRNCHPSKTTHCKYCSTTLQVSKIINRTTSFIKDSMNYGFHTIDDEGRTGEFGYHGRRQLHSMEIKSCPNHKCGWWILGQDIEWVPAEAAICFYHYAEYKIYNTQSADVSIEELRREIAENPKLVYRTHYDTFEKIIAACIRDKFPGSNVTHVGRSGDGGVDVYCVIGSEPCLVQVKRRGERITSEGPSVVRELNGVLMREGVYRGMVITTAPKFTSTATKETQIRMPLERPVEVDLIAFDGVIDMIRETASFSDTESGGAHYPWQPLLVAAETD